MVYLRFGNAVLGTYGEDGAIVGPFLFVESRGLELVGFLKSGGETPIAYGAQTEDGEVVWTLSEDCGDCAGERYNRVMLVSKALSKKPLLSPNGIWAKAG